MQKKEKDKIEQTEPKYYLNLYKNM